MGGTPSYPTPPTDKAIFVPATGQSAGGTRDVSGMSNPLRAASGSSASSILGAAELQHQTGWGLRRLTPAQR